MGIKFTSIVKCSTIIHQTRLTNRPIQKHDHNNNLNNKILTTNQKQIIFSSISVNQNLNNQRLKEVQNFVERWVNMIGFFGPFVLCIVGAFVLVKSFLGFMGALGDYFSGVEEGKDVSTMIKEYDDELKTQRMQRGNYLGAQQEVAEIEEELLSKEQLIEQLKQQRKLSATMVNEADTTWSTTMNGHKTPTDSSTTSSATLPSKIESSLSSTEKSQSNATPIPTPTMEEYGTYETQREFVDGKAVSGVVETDKKKQKPYQAEIRVDEKTVEVTRPWWMSLDRISIVQFQLKNDDQAMPLYIEANFNKEETNEGKNITIIGFESFQEAVDFYKYMVPKWQFEAEQGGEYPMWRQVAKMDIQQLNPIDFSQEVQSMGFSLEVIPKGEIQFGGDMSYADFYERVLTVCKIPGWEEAVMQHTSWEDFDNDLEAVVKRQKEDTVYTGPGSVEGAQGYTIF